jgi:predicted DNA-binding protein
MTITISLSPEQERRLAERAAQAGQEVAAYVHRLIDHDIRAEEGYRPDCCKNIL